MIQAVAALLAAVALLGGGVGARAAPAQQYGEWRCEPLIRAAEKSEGIPPGLLMAIGRAESGVDTSWGRLIWPWALNIAGRSVFAKDRTDALRQARESLAADPRRFIDLGCLQINWQYHRDWLQQPETALDPSWNVAYGARLLRNLAAQHGSWEKAVGFYHSSNPLRQATYLAAVARAYCDGTRTAALCHRKAPSAGAGPVKRVVVRIYRGSDGKPRAQVATPGGGGSPPRMIRLQ
ncbi:MAG: transglycosylase SLT domain-containing protein [Alphaproteobacteria bacterium]|nr:transglycosylase SLT domain-containing protein [Alphaproteobacteria bacterium]